MSHLPKPLYGFAIFFLIFWCGTWCVHLLAICYGKYKLHKKSCKLPNEAPLPGVSILKPLMGVDPNLQHNLETFFTMDYPVYELLFCIEDKSDPAIKLVENLLAQYPHVDATLFLGGSNVGVNPKINNMHPGYLKAKYELLMISDSGIKMKSDTLLDMVQNMGDKYALVHQMPFTADREGFAATFEKIFFGTVQSRIYLSADLLGINCHTGMSCLLRKNVIDELGGLRRFGCYLAEDFFIAKAITDAGWKMRISCQPALQNSGICDISTFQQRLIRWAKLRVAMVPTTILLEPLSECMILGAFAAWSASLLFKWDPLVFYLVHVLTWFLSDWVLLSIVQHGSLPFHKFEFVIGWLFRELSGPYLFLHALWNPSIRWRTRTYKLAWGGIAYELPLNTNTINHINTNINTNTNNLNNCNIKNSSSLNLNHLQNILITNNKLNKINSSSSSTSSSSLLISSNNNIHTHTHLQTQTHNTINTNSNNNIHSLSLGCNLNNNSNNNSNINNNSGNNINTINTMNNNSSSNNTNISNINNSFKLNKLNSILSSSSTSSTSTTPTPIISTTTTSLTTTTATAVAVTATTTATIAPTTTSTNSIVNCKTTPFISMDLSNSTKRLLSSSS